MTDDLGAQPFHHLTTITTPEAVEEFLKFAAEQGASPQQRQRARDAWEADRCAMPIGNGQTCQLAGDDPHHNGCRVMSVQVLGGAA